MNPRYGKNGQRRAISPIIATVLIIAVTLIASVAIGGFVFGIFAQGQNSAQVAVTGTALLAAYFPSGETSKAYVCTTTTTGSRLPPTTTDTDSSSVATISFRWPGGKTEYT